MTPVSQSRDDTLLAAGRDHSTHAARLSIAFDRLAGSGLSYCCRWPVKRKRALLGSNPPRNSRLETHADGREPIGTGWLPPLGGRQSQQHLRHRGRSPDPLKPTLAIARWRPVIPLRNGIQGNSCGSTVAWCPPLGRQTRRLEVVRRSLPGNVAALLTSRIGGLLRLDLLQHG
jgi:hypothetical protein